MCISWFLTQAYFSPHSGIWFCLLIFWGAAYLQIPFTSDLSASENQYVDTQMMSKSVKVALANKQTLGKTEFCVTAQGI